MGTESAIKGLHHTGSHSRSPEKEFLEEISMAMLITKTMYKTISVFIIYFYLFSCLEFSLQQAVQSYMKLWNTLSFLGSS